LINKNSKIAIVGAGPAGLTAAWRFIKNGYNNVTVYEKTDQVGGKCRTVDIEGRPYELGAIMQAPAYKTVLGLAREVGLKERKSPTMYDYNEHKLVEKLWYRNPEIYKLPVARLLLTMYRHRQIYDTGFVGLSKNFAIPFADWLKKHRLEDVGRFVSTVITGFGYGYFEEVPAAYLLKYSRLFYALKSYEIDRRGIQTLWERLSESINVRKNSVIESIIRQPNSVTIKCNGQIEETDLLLLACGLDDASNYLDVTKSERSLFEKIRYYDYHTFAISIDNFPKDRAYLMLTERQSAAHSGAPVFYSKRWPDTNVVVAYLLGKSSLGMSSVIPEEELIAAIEKDVIDIGGSLRKVHNHFLWKYFPHVNSADFADGFYDKLDALQGQNRTYYVGELLNFSTVETAATHGLHIVDRILALRS